MIHYVNTTTGKLGPALPLRDVPLLGLSDPAFSPDGRFLAYTMEGVTHNYGTPSIWIYSGGAPRELAAGYRAASWSPGREVHRRHEGRRQHSQRRRS